MPRYFVHSDDGHFFVHDHEGLELADPYAARNAALAVLPDMTRDELPDGDRRIFTVTVEDEGGQVLYTAKLELTGEWKVAPPPVAKGSTAAPTRHVSGARRF